MKVAFIAPPKLLVKLPGGMFKAENHIMMLPEFFDSPDYLGWHATRLEFKILDNGVAEGNMMGNEKLMAMANNVRATELVVPDVMGDMEKTVTAVTSFMAIHNSFQFKPPRLMGVVQGNDFKECMELVRFYRQIKHIKTLGIPRWLVNNVHASFRIKLVALIRQEYKSDFAIHLLGASHAYPDECQSVERAHPGFVRSIDTSLPFTYAQLGLDLSPRYNVPRQPSFKDFEWDKVDTELAIRNCNRFSFWAQNA